MGKVVWTTPPASLSQICLIKEGCLPSALMPEDIDLRELFHSHSLLVKQTSLELGLELWGPYSRSAFATISLCGLGQITEPLWTTVSSSFTNTVNFPAGFFLDLQRLRLYRVAFRITPREEGEPTSALSRADLVFVFCFLSLQSAIC